MDDFFLNDFDGIDDSDGLSPCVNCGNDATGRLCTLCQQQAYEDRVDDEDDYPQGPWDSDKHMKSEIDDWLRANGREDEIVPDEH